MRVLKEEGGYGDDPSDSGGPTNFGVTLGDYRRYIDSSGSAIDVKNMTKAQAKIIYKTRYWDALGCDDLPSGVDYTCFDYGVNSGLQRPRKALQKFKLLKDTKLIDAINDERTVFLKSIAGGKNAKFLRGWLSRVSRVRAYSKFLSDNATKDNTTGPAVGAGTVAIAVGSTSYFHTHQTAIIIGSIVLAIIVGAIIHLYKNKGKF